MMKNTHRCNKKYFVKNKKYKKMKIEIMHIFSSNTNK